MDDYFILIVFSLIGGLLSLCGGLLLVAQPKNIGKFVKYATPFAAGALLAAVFMDLLPEGLEEGDSKTVLLAALSGILLFFIAERFLRWFHHHHSDDEKHSDPTTTLIVAGDTLHNALDGIAIAAAFLVSVPTGIVTTLAIAAHEIPQEIGDFGLLLSKGMRRKNVIIVNVTSALATTVAAVITYSLGSENTLPIDLLLGLSAGFLLYIALSDIIPTIHEKTDASKLVQLQTLMLLFGVVAVGLSVQAAHAYLDSRNDNDNVYEMHDHAENHAPHKHGHHER